MIGGKRGGRGGMRGGGEEEGQRGSTSTLNGYNTIIIYFGCVGWMGSPWDGWMDGEVDRSIGYR